MDQNHYLWGSVPNHNIKMIDKSLWHYLQKNLGMAFSPIKLLRLQTKNNPQCCNNVDYCSPTFVGEKLGHSF